MRILIFGKDGQVGRALQESLCGVAEIAAFGHDDLDVRDINAVRNAIVSTRPDIVINATAYTNVDVAEGHPELAMEVNAFGPGHIATEAERAGAAVIHYSTDYVFDGARETPYRENTIPNPINVYGKSKLAGDVAVQASGAAHIILRTSWVFSAHGHNFVRTMLRLGSEQTSLSVVDDQYGRPTSADLIASVTRDLIHQSAGNPVGFFRQNGGIVNVSCRGKASWFSLAKEVFRLAHQIGIPLMIKDLHPISSSEYDYIAPRPIQTCLSLDRLQRDFLITPPDWRAALKKVLTQIEKRQSMKFVTSTNHV